MPWPQVEQDAAWEAEYVPDGQAVQVEAVPGKSEGQNVLALQLWQDVDPSTEVERNIPAPQDVQEPATDNDS